MLAAAATAALLAGPFVLAFFSGGYFEGPRLAAAIGAWACAGTLAAATAGPLRLGRPALVAIAGLGLLCAWVAIERGRAPLADPAGADLQRDVLYLGALVAAALAVRSRPVGRLLEPVLAAGSLVVIGYGLAGRLVPDLVVQHDQVSAGGRLDQPLTYWNATGALAAVGMVLAVRLAGDPTRARALRAAAGAAVVPLGLGAYLSYSRGALGALGAGLAVLVLVAGQRSQVRAVVVGIAGAGLAVLAASRLPGVASLAGDAASRRADGAIMLAVLVVLAAGCALACVRGGRWSAGPLQLPRRVTVAGWALAVAIAAAPYAAALADHGQATANPAFGANSARLSSAGSHRYAYWRVAVDTWLDHPLDGTGPGSFRVAWLAHRPIGDFVQDAHSLELQTLAELGLVGLAALALLFGGVAGALRRLAARDRALAAGPAAALAVWAIHAGVDWDWQMPGLTLVAAVLAGGVLGLSDGAAGERPLA